MFLRQMEYYIAIVETGSFTEAAEKCHVSQSAISQQIKKLEYELGTELLLRHNRSFSLTEAGELFYRKCLVITNDIGQLKRDVRRMKGTDRIVLRAGYLRSYAGPEFRDAAAQFSMRYPDVELRITDGDHEQLYHSMQLDDLDIVFNDRRRAFLNDYEIFELGMSRSFIEISSFHPFARLSQIDVTDLKNMTCIIVADSSQEAAESMYYREYLGFTSDHIFANTLSDARMMAASGKGYLPVDGVRHDLQFDNSISRIPLFRDDQPVSRTYSAFWRINPSNRYITSFAEILWNQFEHHSDTL